MAKKTKEKSLNCYISRDLSWLEFNRRVLMQAADGGTPLLERLKFFSIYQSNLDEFFMVRVGSLQHRSMFFPQFIDSKTGRNADEELKAILRAVESQQSLVTNIYNQIIEDFRANGIEMLNFKHLSKVDELMVKKIFTEIRDIISPRIIDDKHSMPFLGNGDRYVMVRLEKDGTEKLGIISLYRFDRFRMFETSGGKQKVVNITDLLNYFAPQIFKKFTVLETTSLRVTRNADIFIEEYENGFLGDELGNMKKMLRKRKRELPVRLQFYGKPSKEFRRKMAGLIDISEDYVFTSLVPFDLSFGSVINASKEMKYVPRKSVRSINLQKGEYFKALETKDLLISFPFQSINPFIDMLYEAADDPEVVSIKITLYRLSASSKLAAALAYAADKGKDVLCLLELRARFDEQNNIDYSELLEDAGCKVIYGIPDKKVHSKLCLISRNCSGSMKYITQIGTGNYNEVTSEQYTDFSFITSRQKVGEDAVKFFDALEAGEVPPATDHLITAPVGFKKIVLELLDREIAKGEDGYVFFKCNSMNDVDVMNKLIECSQAGVRVEMVIRSICCLIPGVAGYTDNITSKSIVGRYLEHSRIYLFGKGNDRRVLIGSGDLLNRNTQRRVEAFAEVTHSNVLQDVLEVVNALKEDLDNAWVMQSDGTYEKLPRGTASSSQDKLYQYFSQQEITAPVKKQGFLQRLFGKK